MQGVGFSGTLLKRGRAIMKVMGLVLVVILVFAGCASYQHSEMIDTDASGGYAVGKYSSSSGGPSGSFHLAGGGGGWGSSGGGAGVGVLSVDSRPPAMNSYNFARSVATINYSKRLRSIKYDETGGIIDYDFGGGPVTMKKDFPASRSSLPSSFGHQPIQ
jgi:hypothetical protein